MHTLGLGGKMLSQDTGRGEGLANIHKHTDTECISLGPARNWILSDLCQRDANAWAPPCPGPTPTSPTWTNRCVRTAQGGRPEVAMQPASPSLAGLAGVRSVALTSRAGPLPVSRPLRATCALELRLSRM